jgi:SanA protein
MLVCHLPQHCERSQVKMSFANRRKRLVRCIVAFVLALSAIILAANIAVLSLGGPLCTSSLDRLASADVAIVLGSDDAAAIQRRSDAARRLLERNIVSKILISGNPQNRGRNEVQLIAGYLIESGVPTSKLIHDENGRNTRRTIDHAKASFRDRPVILVTDDYHSARTMFLARRARLNASCFTSQSGWNSLTLMKVHLREYLSRTKAVAEAYLLGY